MLTSCPQLHGNYFTLEALYPNSFFHVESDKLKPFFFFFGEADN